MLRKVTAAVAGAVALCISAIPNAHATGDVWVEGSYEFLSLPDVNFVNQYRLDGTFSRTFDSEFQNDDGDFDGFRIDGGIADIPVMGGAYLISVQGFFSEHDDRSPLICALNVDGGGVGGSCHATALVDDPSIGQFVGNLLPGPLLFTTEREATHWGASLAVAQGANGLRAGPAFRRIGQDLTIIGQSIAPPGAREPFLLTYAEDLDTDYYGGFVGAVFAVPLGGGWSLAADGEAGLYWAHSEYDGNYQVVNASLAGGLNPNVSQQLSLESDELAFIGILKASLEKDLGLFRIAGFGRIEYISSAPDVAYNDLDTIPAGSFLQGPDDETRVGERFAYSASVGARITVPMGGQ